MSHAGRELIFHMEPWLGCPMQAIKVNMTLLHERALPLQLPGRLAYDDHRFWHVQALTTILAWWLPARSEPSWSQRASASTRSSSLWGPQEQSLLP